MDLTKREAEVAAHLAAGYTNKEIGRRLHIETVTVNNHVRSILSKTNAPNRTTAVVSLLIYNKLSPESVLALKK